MRSTCYGVLRFVTDDGAKGCRVLVSGKLRRQRIKSMECVDGLMIHRGGPANYCVDTAMGQVLASRCRSRCPGTLPVRLALRNPCLTM